MKHVDCTTERKEFSLRLPKPPQLGPGCNVACAPTAPAPKPSRHWFEVISLATTRSVTPCLPIVVFYLTTGPEQPSDAHIMADIGKRKREDEEVPPADLEEVKKALLKAARRGDAETITALLAGTDLADPDADISASSALTAAAANGHRQAVQALLAAGAVPSAEGIEAAAEFGDFHLLRTMVAAGSEAAQECLCNAASTGDGDTLQLLLAAGAEIAGSGALAAAAEYGHLPLVELLLARGANPDEPYLAVPGLTLAARQGHAEVMRVLLAAGADIEARSGDSNYSRALEECSTVETARVALAAGAVLQDAAQGYVPLVRVAALGESEVVSLLLEAGAPVDAVAGPQFDEEEGRTALYAAVEAGRVRVVQQLLAAGANANTALNATTALHLAATLGKEDCVSPLRAVKIVQLLLAAGADVGAEDTRRNTALHCAHCAPVIQALVAAGAPLEARNAADNTPLSRAMQRGTKECVLALLAASSVPPLTGMTLALQAGWRGRWLTALLPASRSITAQQLTEWAVTGLAGEEAGGSEAAGEAIDDDESAEDESDSDASDASEDETGGAVASVAEAASADPESYVAALARRQRMLRMPDDQAARAAKQRLVWQVWALRSRLPPELLRLVAAMCCILP